MATAETPALDLRDDLNRFAEEVLRAPLFAAEGERYQREAAGASEHVVVVVGGRRSGKSHFAMVKAIHTAATKRGARVLVVSPTIDKSKDFMRDLQDLLRRSRLTGSVVDDQALVVTFSTGSEVRCVPSTSGQIRGRGHRLFLAILDEAAFLLPEVWGDLRYTLLDERANGSQAVMISTPWGPPDHFFRESYFRGVDGDGDIAAFRWPTCWNPLLRAEDVEKERARLSADEARAELDAEFVDHAGAFFSRDLLERQTADVMLPAFEELLPAAMPGIGIDWGGMKRDRSAVVALYRLAGMQDLNPDREIRPRFLVLSKVWHPHESLSDVWRTIADVPTRFYWLSSKTNGVGSGPSEELIRTLRERRRAPKGWNPLATTNAKKAAGYVAVLSLLEREQLVLPRDPDLLRTLANLTFEQRSSGMTRIEAEDEAVGDDVCDALMAATCPYVPKNLRGRVIVELMRHATDRAAPDWKLQPDRVGPVVATGGDLRLPESPVLQSVVGMEITPPQPKQGDEL